MSTFPIYNSNVPLMDSTHYYKGTSFKIFGSHPFSFKTNIDLDYYLNE